MGRSNSGWDKRVCDCWLIYRHGIAAGLHHFIYMVDLAVAQRSFGFIWSAHLGASGICLFREFSGLNEV